MTASKNYRTRLRGDDRSTMAGELASLYLAGASIRAVAASRDLSYGTARLMLMEMGVKLRARSGSPHKARPDAAKAGGA